MDDELYKWVSHEIEGMRFGSYSHAINYALRQLKKANVPKGSKK